MISPSSHLLPIVEGEGDERAVPELLRRILYEELGRYDIQVLKPHRRGELPKVKTSFPRFFETAALENASIICILDFDCAFCDDVEREEHHLRQTAHHIRPDVPFGVCLIVKEFESLFLWDEKSTRKALPMLKSDTVWPENPEAVRDAKGWLSKAQPSGYSYKPTTDQAKLSKQVDLSVLKQCSPSYQRLLATLEQLFPSDTVPSDPSDMDG